VTAILNITFITMAPKYLITAASGHIGQRIVPLLASHPSQPELFLVTSSAERLTKQLGEHAQNARIHVVEGSIADPSFMEATLRDNGVTAIVMALTGDNELFLTGNLLDAIKHAGCVRHVVYISIAGDYGITAIQAGALTRNTAPHNMVKYLTEARLRHGTPAREAGGFSWTILGPTLFNDNDLRSKASLLEDGHLDEPHGAAGVSRVDCLDIALAAVNALVDDGKRWGGKKVMIGGKDRYTGAQIADLWSKALGKPVSHLECDAEGLRSIEKKFTGIAGPAWGRDVRMMYEYFNEAGFGMSDEEYDEQVELLGRPPVRYEDFVKKTAAEWLYVDEDEHDHGHDGHDHAH
jgi:uncharacterized protein YbjT (DUF2867 family)